MTTELISFLSKCFNTAVVNVIYFLFCKNVYGAKDYKKIVFVLACIASTCLTILVNRANNPYMNIICTYAALNATSVLLFNAKFKTAWLYNTLLWFLSAFCDTITVIAWSAVRGETLDKILGDYQLMLCSNLTNMLLLIAMYMVYTTILKKVELYDVQWKLALFMALLAFFEVLVIIFFASEINTKQGGLKIIFISVGLIATNIFLSYIIAQVSKVYKYKYELSLAERLKEIQLENYKQINEKYQQSRIIIHDIKKHLMVIDNLKNKDSEEYSNNIYKRLDELFCGFHCSCEILSIVMSQKIAVARAEGINVVTKMTDVSLEFMDDLDVTAIFANLWDNAIEACRKVGDSKYINVQIGKLNNFIFISMENSCNGKLIPNGKYFESTKMAHEGIGISSIKKSVEKYNGFFSTKSDGNIFKSEISIPIIENSLEVKRR